MRFQGPYEVTELCQAIPDFLSTPVQEDIAPIEPEDTSNVETISQYMTDKAVELLSLLQATGLKPTPPKAVPQATAAF